eukprot:CAMPEP_0113823224 /NCGR_PEP_ID=MMETSP0328-20130328/2635_1 /TAXON_ID=39455 /ORGANISM="Alexandrium minutum" /LENGTH=251 /DNA_ID=CAMNT_0000791163 /DNA_START=91 /DNA_END=847 /DNA_ORIENTATION=- /assembly_acc=CAM_ASM_000350
MCAEESGSNGPDVGVPPWDPRERLSAAFRQGRTVRKALSAGGPRPPPLRERAREGLGLQAGAGASGEADHVFPTVRWQVGVGSHDLGSGLELVQDRQVFFVEAGQRWQLRNAGPDVYRQVLFEIKQPPKYTAEQVKERLARARYSTDVGTALLFDNHLCRVWDFYLEPGEGNPLENTHHHVLDYCFVYVAPGRLLGYHHDGRPGLFDSVNEDNDVTWFDIAESAPDDPTFAHGGKNGYDDRPMREYLVELK